MRFRPIHMSKEEQQVFKNTQALLAKGLENKDLLNWALDLEPIKIGEREAILFTLGNLKTDALKEPWHSAWNLLAESYQSETARIMRFGESDQFIANKMKSKNISQSVVNEICNYVEPWLELEKPSTYFPRGRKEKKNPRHVYELLYSGMSSNRFPREIDSILQRTEDVNFVAFLVSHLFGSIQTSYNLGRRIGWDEKQNWRLGLIYRVYFVTGCDEEGNELDPDEFHRGISPLIKLYYTALLRLHELAKYKAEHFILKLKESPIGIDRRLWAALARNKLVASGNVVFKFISELPVRDFWNAANDQPEILELLAVRFDDISEINKSLIIKKILKGPPKALWKGRDVSDSEFKEIKDYWITREFKRISIGSNEPPEIITNWLDENLHAFPELLEMDTVDFDFSRGVTIRSVPSQPDMSFNSIHGQKRLKELEGSFATEAVDSWEKPNAHDWLFQPNHLKSVLDDLESPSVDVNKYPYLLNKIAQIHMPTEQKTENHEAGKRFLKILYHLNSNSFNIAHKGLSNWLANWIDYIKKERKLFSVWEATWNASVVQYKPKGQSENTLTGSSDSPSERWMIVTPIWELTRVFIKLCPNLNDKKRPFRNGRLRNMRNVLDTAQGEILEISNFLLLKSISYFFSADEKWTRQRLIPALQDGSNNSAWEALARADYLSPKVLHIIGEQLVEKSADSNLSRNVRNNFAARLIGDVMHAYRESNATTIPANLVTRMLRKIDDEVRVHAAMQLSRFFRYWTGKHRREEISEKYVISPEDFWERVICPIIQNVWPRDIHLITPGIADAFANLPALSGEYFSMAVDEIEHYLLPFDCWSMNDYGFGFQDDDELVNVVKDSSKARALLKLLDRTIGTEEDSVVPYDLSIALGHISKIDKKLAGNSTFKRLQAQLR